MGDPIPDGGFKMSDFRYRCSPTCGGLHAPHPDAWNGANAKAQVARDDRRFHHDPCADHADKFIRDVTHWASEQGCPSHVVIADWLKTQKIANADEARRLCAWAKAHGHIQAEQTLINWIERQTIVEDRVRLGRQRDRALNRERLLARCVPILADAFPTHPEVAALLAEIKGLVE